MSLIVYRFIKRKESEDIEIIAHCPLLDAWQTNQLLVQRMFDVAGCMKEIRNVTQSMSGDPLGPSTSTEQGTDITSEMPSLFNIFLEYNSSWALSSCYPFHTTLTILISELIDLANSERFTEIRSPHHLVILLNAVTKLLPRE